MDLLSCINCRIAKRKCNKALPTCSLCSKKSKKCIYPLKDGRKATSKDYVKALLTRIEHLEEQRSATPSSSSSFQFLNEDINHSFALDEEVSTLVTIGSSSNVNPNFRSSKFPKDNPESLIGDFMVQLQRSLSMRLIKILSTDTSDSKPNFQTSKTKHFIFDQMKKNEHIISYFFENMGQSLPLIDPIYFLGSWQNVSTIDDLSGFCSIGLLGCMMCYYNFCKNRTSEFNTIKNFVTRHVDLELTKVSSVEGQIANVQCLILLSIMCMSSGDETEGSQFIARAVVLVQHYGFLDERQSLIEVEPMNSTCIRMRKLLFWCCFLIDRISSTILGTPPYLGNYHLKSFKESLFEDKSILYESGFSGIGTFLETLNFYIMESDSIDHCYKSQSTKGNLEKNLCISSIIVNYHQWKKDMVSNSRFKNKKDLPVLFLEVSRLTLLILIYKTKIDKAYCSEAFEVKETMKYFHQDYLNAVETSQGLDFFDIIQKEKKADKLFPSLVCLESSKSIIGYCSDHDISNSLFLHRFIYSIYVSCVICVFNTTSSQLSVKVSSIKYLKKGLKLLENQSKPCSIICYMYIDNLLSYSLRFMNSNDINEVFNVS